MSVVTGMLYRVAGGLMSVVTGMLYGSRVRR